MEENVALDSTKKKKFLKSIKSLKKLIKKNEEEVVEMSLDGQRKKLKRVRPERGLVYLSHIPHGFYEHQMTEYFKQFGAVTNVRVIRSRRTGRSKGFAFVEFKEPSVAEIVAETMNNYLMGKRLIKAAYIPPQKIRRFTQRINWNEVHHPAAVERIKHKKAFNAMKNDSQELKKAKKLLSNLERTKKKLSELGINYDFMPVDIPLELIKIKQEQEETQNTAKEEADVKPTKKEKKKGKQNDVDKKTIEEKKQANKSEPVKAEKEVKPKNESKANKIVPKVNKNEPKANKAKKDKPDIKVDKKEQEQKQKKLDKAGVKSVENFIKVQESDDDSDSSADFDSDEYEKIMNNESDIGSDESEESGDESGDEDGDDDEDDDDNEDDNDDEVEDSESGEESVVDYPPVKPKQKVPLVVVPKTMKKQEPVSKNAQVKRKAPQKATVTPKKPKFEKQNKPVPVKKQFKKKK